MDDRVYVSPNQYRQIAKDMDDWSRDRTKKVLPRICLRVAAKWLLARVDDAELDLLDRLTREN